MEAMFVFVQQAAWPLSKESRRNLPRYGLIRSLRHHKPIQSPAGESGAASKQEAVANSIPELYPKENTILRLDFVGDATHGESPCRAVKLSREICPQAKQSDCETIQW
jgi:hypothetical protein